MRPNGTSQQALEFLKRSMSVKEIAAKLKVNECSVRRWRQEHQSSKKKRVR
jgi:uncharacterized protein YjcR